jgi:SAM-dependent methyltransferase
MNMNDYDSSTYGERIAGVYDLWFGGFDEAAVALLGDLARGGRVLELGIGTGRIALPLAERGVEVHGIDASAAMVGRLRARPGGGAIPVIVGDFTQIEVEGLFSLVYVVVNTFFCLTSQEDQVRCFRSVADHLSPDGVFLIEAFVPDLGRFSRGQNIQVSRVETDSVTLELARHDPVLQQAIGQQIHITEAGIRLYPVRVRYAWPSELDLMAQLAGLQLLHRWGGWHREPFTAASLSHVSVYGREARR